MRKSPVAVKNTEMSLIRDALLGARQPVTILSHPSPDGDSIGSTLALWGILRAAGVGVEPVLESLPRAYAFLAAGLEIARPPVDLAGKVALVLDCSDLSRLDQVGQSLAGAVQVINIDHHLHNECFGDLNYVDSQAAAVGEIIYRMFRDYPQYINPRSAEALYTALVTDTGRFSYSNTTAATLETGAALIARGARPNEVFRQVYQGRSPAYLAFLSQALAGLEYYFSGRVVLLPLERGLLSRYELEEGELEDVSDYPQSLADAALAIVLRETADGNTRVNLRSKGRNVASIARAFGGGGHNNAAGATLPCSLAEARQLLLKYLEGEEVL
jgi:phosphoesterase RecJ-like protein